jgi:hypothetical protein
MRVITPAEIVTLDDEFVENYHDSVVCGMVVARNSRVVVCGLARQIADVVPLTKQRLEHLATKFLGFEVIVVENDSTDGTADLFRDWDPGFDVIVDSEKLDRPHLPAQRDAERTTALAEYRQKCVELVQRTRADYVIVMDYDAWGGFLPEGIMSSLHYLSCDDQFFGLGSVGMAQIPQLRNPDGTHNWFNYDAWAFRPEWSWRQRPEMWIHHLVPPFGCPPLKVNSCFGGLAVYNANDFVLGTYSGVLFGSGDCEHVSFHRSISVATGRSMGLNPSSVGVMFWAPTDDSE